MRILDLLRQRLRGTPAEASSVIDVVRAATFGDEVDAAKAAERWAIAERERDEEQERRERDARVAREIADTCKKHGVWYPPSHGLGRFERFR